MQLIALLSCHHCSWYLLCCHTWRINWLIDWQYHQYDFIQCPVHASSRRGYWQVSDRGQRWPGWPWSPDLMHDLARPHLYEAITVIVVTWLGVEYRVDSVSVSCRNATLRLGQSSVRSKRHAGITTLYGTVCVLLDCDNLVLSWYTGGSVPGALKVWTLAMVLLREPDLSPAAAAAAARSRCWILVRANDTQCITSIPTIYSSYFHHLSKIWAESDNKERNYWTESVTFYAFTA